MTKTTEQLNLKARLREASKEERQAILDGLPHTVGFAKPPKASQFKTGQSGNPKGRSKGARNLGKILVEELEQRIEVNEGGRRRKLSKGRVAARQVVNKAASGDMKAFATATDLLRKTGQLAEAPAPHGQFLSADDLQAAADLLRFYAPARETSDQGGTQ